MWSKAPITMLKQMDMVGHKIKRHHHIQWAGPIITNLVRDTGCWSNLSKTLRMPSLLINSLKIQRRLIVVAFYLIQ